MQSGYVIPWSKLVEIPVEISSPTKMTHGIRHNYMYLNIYISDENYKNFWKYIPYPFILLDENHMTVFERLDILTSTEYNVMNCVGFVPVIV